MNLSQKPLCLVTLKAPLKSRYLSDKSKERRGEVNCPVLVYRLIHPDEFLESQSVWTLAAEPERRIHILQHVVHLGVVNPPSESGILHQPDGGGEQHLLSTGVVLGPDSDELVQVVSPQDGAVSRQVVKVVHDDGHEQVEHEEAAEEDEGDKEEVSDVAAAGLARIEELPCGGVPLEGPGVAGLASTTRQHDVGPRLSCGAPATPQALSTQGGQGGQGGYGGYGGYGGQGEYGGQGGYGGQGHVFR